jgi:hypothetical protein
VQVVDDRRAPPDGVGEIAVDHRRRVGTDDVHGLLARVDERLLRDSRCGKSGAAE